jgi:xanthine dehydrogenase YagR molybdenum-binding subunit
MTPQAAMLEYALVTGIVVAPEGLPAALPTAGIGAAQRRVDGVAKVTGAALFAGEDMPAGTVYAAFVGAPVAKGRLRGVDAATALSTPGVLRVLTMEDMPDFRAPPVPPFGQALVPLSTDVIHHEGQPVAIVVAETLEAAEEGAALVALDCVSETPLMFADAATVVPGSAGRIFLTLDLERGDVERALADATCVVDETYLTPSHHHNMMEPHATLAWWHGDRLFMRDATQWGFGVRYALAAILGMRVEDVTVECPYVGGGFGCKGYVWPHQILIPATARIMQRPVKFTLGRDGCFTGCGYQPEMLSRVRLGADVHGRLTAIDHVSENLSARFDDYVEYGTAGSRATYRVDNYSFRTRIRRADVGVPTPMRAPHEGPGMFATESAIDELAWQLGVDPLQFRIDNHADTDVTTGKPFSSKKLLEAYLEGARRFGWSARAQETRARREDGKLIGVGVATGIMATFRHLSSARLVLGRDGRVAVEAGTHEIGTGSRTVLHQIAAEKLGLDADRLSVEIGSTDLHETAGAFGSGTSIGTGSAVADAADKLLAELRDLADGAAVPDSAQWGELLERKGLGEIAVVGHHGPPNGAMFDAHGELGDHTMFSFGAIFTEMEVDEDFGTARLRRAVGCYSAGRILNPVTARSQMIGGIIWGYGRAMLHDSPMDPRYGRFLSKNLSGVMVPVNADIPPRIDISFIEEYDPHCSAIGVRGIGELGEVGVAASIANAIYHATGKRIRELPIRLHHLVS